MVKISSSNTNIYIQRGKETREREWEKVRGGAAFGPLSPVCLQKNQQNDKQEQLTEGERDALFYPNEDQFY